ncbi:aminoglycoside phosphotransferase family protein [Bradyrhizobium quebecense]|uniref:Phosphotransferase n=1 Tax=Bradyrhizobium quebecense TaxID=2748629 RepID=A0A974AFD6_9BRAD|nr:phosphotransferase [Bradyrhizobium quebecense]UGA46063.1 aminoglycoside phosphotransferase family protein [Bradyrhizobium quebecense]
MKRLGRPGTAAEKRAERAIGNMPIIDANRALYELSAFPVASPSYHAVESTTFNIALGGNGASLLLRLANDEVAELVDDEVAFVAAQRLHGLGLSPAPVARAPAERAVLFSRLGDGWRTAKIDDLMQGAAVVRLVDMQKTIAAGEPLGRSWSVFDGIDRLWPLVATSSAVLPGDVDWMLAWMTSIREAISAAGVELKPAHGDPQCSNVMLGLNDAMMLVDFDMAGDIDPYYQLGVQMNELYLFESQMKPLLEMHDGQFSEKAFSRCRLYAAADDLYWALRSLLQDVRSPLQGVEFLKYASWRFLRCRMLLGHPSFEERVRSL